MSEASILKWVERSASRIRIPPEMVLGIGDDCAVVRPKRGSDLVFTSDLCLEGRHFILHSQKTGECQSAAQVGHLALARSLSDLAAMGAQPIFCLVSLAIPQTLSETWVKDFYAGLSGLAAAYRCAIAGGDLSRFDRVLVDVTCCGRVTKGQALLRSGAKQGDAIYVSGTLGGAAQAFRVGPESPHWDRRVRPEPRIALGVRLRKHGVTACMDLSDGLSLDLQRLAISSGVAAELEGDLPIAASASLDDALHGGEDYELLFTSSKPMPSKISGLKVTRIGSAVKGKPGLVRYRGKPLNPGGFDHFAM